MLGMSRTHSVLVVGGEVHVQVQRVSLLLPLPTHQLQVDNSTHALSDTSTGKQKK